MRKIKFFTLLSLVALFAFSLVGCGSKEPKSVNAEKNLAEVIVQLDAVIKEEHFVTDEYSYEIVSISFVEITNDDMLESIIGNVYYKISFKVTSPSGWTEDGTGYGVYYSEEDFVGSVGIRTFYGDSYSEYHKRVTSEYYDTEGVVGTLAVPPITVPAN